MAAGSVLAFCVVSLLLIVVPGADWAFTIGAGYVAGSPAILTGLTIAGGGYLMWHGAMTLARGVGVSGLNPKGLLLLLALLPQFTDPHAHWPVAGQIGVLGLAFTATVAVVYSGIGCLARTVLRTRPSVARLVGRFSGAAMIAIGAGLVVDRLLS